MSDVFSIGDADALSVAVPLKIKRKALANLLCCGFEGGVGYWCAIKRYIKPAKVEPVIEAGRENAQPCKHTDYPLLEGGAVVCIVEEAGDDKALQGEKVLDLAAVQRGLAVMAEKYPLHFANFLSENEDAETGDVFIQCCLLGDVIFG